MKKITPFLLAFAFSLLVSSTSQAVVTECTEEVCELPPASASQFFLDDVNDLQEIDDLASLPLEGAFWPVEGILTGHYGKWRGGRHSGHYHAGVDIAAPVGTPIYSPLDGTVAFVGRKGGYGLAVVIEHGNGIATLYAHNSDVSVQEGDIVKKGQHIAKVGSSGHSTGPHLHYEVRVEGRPQNPLAWTQRLQAQKS